MNIKVENDNVDKNSRFLWEVYQEEEKRTTPPYNNLKDVKKHLQIRSTHKWDQHLCVYDEDQCVGLALLYVDHDDQTVNIQGPYIKDSSLYGPIANEIMTYISRQFKGMKAYCGTTRENTNSQAFLEETGFVCTENCIQMHLKRDHLNDLEIKFNIEPLTEERMEAYKVFHNELFHDYYWSADRIYKVLPEWKIHLLLYENQIVGSVFTKKQTPREGEVYGWNILAHHKTKEAMAQLLHVNVKSWFDNGLEQLCNFVEDGHDSESATSIGFLANGTYMAYFKNEIK